MNSLILNQGQKDAVAAIFQFLFSDDKEFIISGPAGVGKTFLMKYVMENVLDEYEKAAVLLGLTPVDYEIALTATTNKATEVLQQATGFPAQTIHSFMNLKVKDNYKTGESDLVPTNQWLVHKNRLIFIDEASMVDSKLLKFIHSGTQNSCKIIYLGDHCQMAPVFERISPVYRQPKNFALLTEPVRNAGQPALVALCNQLRDTVETLNFRPLEPVPGVIEYLDNAAAARFIDGTFQTEDVNSRILCFTNQRVQEFNLHIRGLRGYPHLFTKGEILINNSAFELSSSSRLRVEQEVTVVDELRAPYPYVIEPKDANAILQVYDLKIQTSSGSPFQVRVPVDYDHYKLLMKHYAKLKDWNTYYQLKNAFPDLRQKDSATVYKAQGSTYESVFIDLNDIGKCKQPEQAARMLYVGASRATTRLFLYGKLPDRFGGMPANISLSTQEIPDVA